MEDRMILPRESCVVVFQPEDGAPVPLLQTLRELAPMEETDLLAEDGAGRTLMIKAGADAGEIAEFAMALIGTLEAEAGLRLRAACRQCSGLPRTAITRCRIILILPAQTDAGSTGSLRTLLLPFLQPWQVAAEGPALFCILILLFSFFANMRRSRSRCEGSRGLWR